MDSAGSGDHGLWFLDGRIRFHLSQVDNADGISVVEHVLPGGFGPPLHVHRAEDEIFHLIEGEYRFRRGDETLLARAGDVICLPRGIPHGFKVLSPMGRLLTVTRGGFEPMLRAASRAADHDGLPDAMPPTPAMQAELARICAEHGIDLVGPPID